MAKNKKSAVNSSVSPSVEEATKRINTLCVEMGINPTNKYAVMKNLGGNHRFTSWGEKNGKKGLIVLDPMGTSIKFYEDPNSRFPQMRSVKC